MSRSCVLVLVAVFMVFGAVVPASGDSGAGGLMASFRAGLSGGSAIDFHDGVADGFASPQVNPEGRLEPLGSNEFICDELVVGTWVFVTDTDRATLAGAVNEFKLDGDVLDTVRTPLKRVAQGPSKGLWWFAEGVPMLGVLEPGLHDIEFTSDLFLGTFNTAVDVDSSYR